MKELLTSETTKVIVEIISYILLVFGGYFVSKLKTLRDKLIFKHKHGKQFDMKVNNKLIELRALMNSDRASVYLRHNGINFKNGKGLDKISMIYESCNESTVSILDLNQNKGLHLFKEIVMECDSNGFIVIITDNLEDSYIKRDLMSSGIKKVFMFAFRNKKNDIPEGYVILSYVDIDNQEKSDEDIITLSSPYVSDIGHILRS